MKILFSTFGSLGDLHPYIAVALEAKNRGHIPVIATAAKYRAKIEKLGLEFREVRPDLPDEGDFGPLAKRVMDLKDGPRYLFQDILSPTLRQNYTDLLGAVEDCDLLVTHPAALGGPLVARKTGKKWLSSVLAPISLWSKTDPTVPPTLPQLDFLRFLGPLWPTVYITLGKMGTKPWVAEVEKLSRELDLPFAGHPMFEGQYSPHGTLALFSRHFAAPQRDWPTKTTATGFCFYDGSGYGSQREGNWRGWVEAGAAPLVFTLGSSAVFDGAAFFAVGRTEARRTGNRAVFLNGGVAALPEEKSANSDKNELVLDYAPYSELFPKAKIVVHQGGIGTTSQALRAGVPQLIVPFAHDQPDNAGRIQRLGVGLGTALKDYLNGGSKTCFETMLAKYESLDSKAKRVGELIGAENGPLAACEAMEKLF